MRTPIRKLVVMTAAFMLLFAPAALAGTIIGKVVDQTTRAAIHDVYVTLYMQSESGYWGWYDSEYTQPDGKFLFNNLSPGTYVLLGERWTRYNFSSPGKSYYPEFYDDVPSGAGYDLATPIIIAGDETKNLTLDLLATPVSIVERVEYPVAADAGAVGMVRLAIKVKVKNWTATALNLQRWGILDYRAASGVWTYIPQFPAKAFSLKPKEEKVFQHNLDVPANYTAIDLYFEVGPDPGSPWEVYSEGYHYVSPLSSQSTTEKE